jgi:hypothetical protein
MPEEEKPSRKIISSSSRRKWTTHPTVRFFSVSIILLALYWGFGYFTGPGRMTDRLNARLAENPVELNVAVTSKFPPEEFHISIYQRLGSMRGVEDSTAFLHSMTPASVTYLSQYYWIDNIDLIPGKK